MAALPDSESPEYVWRLFVFWMSDDLTSADPSDPPRRKILPHTPPDFVPAGTSFFLTLCARPRGALVFTQDSVWLQVKDAAEHYHNCGRWHVTLLLAMPDHLHLMVSFPVHERMSRVIASWKHYLAGVAGIPWQRDFFDHRPRTSAQLREAEIYIRDNPVRAGLVCDPSDWRYVWPRSGGDSVPRLSVQ